MPIVVLDTNVVFDCLLFDDPHSRPLMQWVEAGRLRWLASAAMRDELAHVLGRDKLAAWRPDTAALLERWDRLAVAMPDGAASALRCTDTDDQKFIDFALAHQARWLISRDRAVLKLARRARPLDLAIVTPQAWLKAVTSAPA